MSDKHLGAYEEGSYAVFAVLVHIKIADRVEVVST
jgi:hypothetical protein